MRFNERSKARLLGAFLLVLFTFVGVMAANEKPQYWSPEAKEGWEAAHENWAIPWKPWAMPQGPILTVMGFLSGVFVFSIIFLITREKTESESSVETPAGLAKGWRFDKKEGWVKD